MKVSDSELVNEICSARECIWQQLASRIDAEKRGYSEGYGEVISGYHEYIAAHKTNLMEIPHDVMLPSDDWRGMRFSEILDEYASALDKYQRIINAQIRRRKEAARRLVSGIAAANWRRIAHECGNEIADWKYGYKQYRSLSEKSEKLFFADQLDDESMKKISKMDFRRTIFILNKWADKSRTFVCRGCYALKQRWDWLEGIDSYTDEDIVEGNGELYSFCLDRLPLSEPELISKVIILQEIESRLHNVLQNGGKNGEMRKDEDLTQKQQEYALIIWRGTPRQLTILADELQKEKFVASAEAFAGQFDKSERAAAKPCAWQTDITLLAYLFEVLKEHDLIFKKRTTDNLVESHFFDGEYSADGKPDTFRNLRQARNSYQSNNKTLSGRLNTGKNGVPDKGPMVFKIVSRIADGG